MKLTNYELDVILCLMDDVNDLSGLKPEELELKEKIERWFENANRKMENE